MLLDLGGLESTARKALESSSDVFGSTELS